MQVVIGFVVVFPGLFEIDDRLRQISTRSVEQIVEGFLSADQFELSRSILGI